MIGGRASASDIQSDDQPRLFSIRHGNNKNQRQTSGSPRISDADSTRRYKYLPKYVYIRAGMYM